MVLFGAWQPRDWTSVLHHNPIWSRVDFLDFLDVLDEQGLGGSKMFRWKCLYLLCKDSVERGQCVYCTDFVFYGEFIVFKSAMETSIFCFSPPPSTLHPSASAYRISHQMKISKCILIPSPPPSLPHI